LLVDEEVVEDAGSEELEAGDAEELWELDCDELAVCVDAEELEVVLICDELGDDVCEVLDVEEGFAEAVLTVAASIVAVAFPFPMGAGVSSGFQIVKLYVPQPASMPPPPNTVLSCEPVGL
jgi:hypothetical protein